MWEDRPAWTSVHDLALVFLALVASAENKLSEDELATMTDVLQGWSPGIDPVVAQDVVMEALDMCADEKAQDRVEESVASIGELPAEKRMLALEYVVRLAGADGVLLRSELEMIQHLAGAWGLHRLARSLLRESAATARAAANWSLLHDIGLLFIALAHGGDRELTADETAAMTQRLQAWHPEQGRDAIYEVLRSALAVYGGGKGALKQSIDAIGQIVPIVQRLLVLEDLLYIADADGATTVHERQMIRNLSTSWGLHTKA